MRSISIPEHVDFIAGSALSATSIASILVDSNNPRLYANRVLLIIPDDSIMIPHFGGSDDVVVAKHITTIGEHASNGVGSVRSGLNLIRCSRTLGIDVLKTVHLDPFVFPVRLEFSLGCDLNTPGSTRLPLRMARD